MPWDPERWHEGLLSLYRKLISLRRELAPLRRGFFQPLWTEDSRGIYAFMRRHQGEKVVVILNASDLVQRIKIENSWIRTEKGQVWREHLREAHLEVKEEGLILEIEPNFGAILSLAYCPASSKG